MRELPVAGRAKAWPALRAVASIRPNPDLFSSDVNFYPPSYQGFSMEVGPVLYGAIKKAVEQKWLDSKMVEKMM